MESKELHPPGIGKPGESKRRALILSQESLIRTGFLDTGGQMPLAIYPSVRGLDLVAWVRDNSEFIETQLCKYGAILFRGFPVRTSVEFEQVIKEISPALLEYRERSSPRTQISGNIYSSTDYPAAHSIFLHNENSYQRTWPLKIFFFCRKLAEEGGETPIADCRKVFQRIDPNIRERFSQKKWMYVRNFGDCFGLHWPTVFQTTDKSAIETHCRANGIEFEWKPGDQLRTRAVRNAIARHPRTGEFVWFNHATFFHVTTLESVVRDVLMAEFDEEDLPTNTYYGDGSQIEPQVLEHLRDAYKQETVVFSWQEGDILLLDNMLVSHGRRPYAGAREVLVGMAEPFSDYRV